MFVCGEQAVEDSWARKLNRSAAILAEDLKDLGGIQPLLFASRFAGQGPLTQAYRNLFAARIRQSRLFRRALRHLGGMVEDRFYRGRYSALEAKAADSLQTIQNAR